VPPPQSPSPAKLAVRDRLLTQRNRLPLSEVVAAGAAIAGHLLAAPEVRRAATVAAYVSVGREPGTHELIEAVRGSGRHVIVPRLLPDLDRDWARHSGDLQRASRGLLEPTGESLGCEAIATADVVLVPGLAVDPSGHRLGRGGGSYDRALGRVPVGTFVCVLLYDEEVLPEVPLEPHDRPVTHVCTPSGLRRLR
jgi:5-formyltetrahydrofolate cyclo-ligase